MTQKLGLVGTVLSVAGVCGAFALAPSEASAQAAEDTGAVSGTAKGIVGGALLGAEVVMIPMGAAGLKPWWPYLVFGAVGAAGGAVGGWAVEQADPPAEAPLYMLAGGLALIIPTIVLTLNATLKDDFEEPPGSTVTTPDSGDPAAQPPPADGTQPAPGTTPPPAGDGTTTIKIDSDAKKHIRRPRTGKARPPTSLFDFTSTELRLGVPAVQVRNMYTQEEMAKFGLEQRTEFNIPVAGVSF